MALSIPPTNDLTILNTNRFSQTWVRWFQSVQRLLTGKEPITLASYTVASVPNAAEYPNAMIYVSNESGGAVPAFSDSVNWRRVTDRAIIS